MEALRLLCCLAKLGTLAQLLRCDIAVAIGGAPRDITFL